MCHAVDSFINVISHPVHMLLGTTAIIEELEDDDSLPYHYFEPTPYDELSNVVKDTITDYIGLLEKKEFTPTAGHDPMLQLTISNTRGRRITAALWQEVNKSAERVNRHALENVKLPALIALSSVKVNYYRGNLQLNSTPATYLYIEAQSPLMTLIKDRWTAKEMELASINQNRVIVTGNNKTTVNELQNMSRMTFVFRVAVTLADISNNLKQSLSAVDKISPQTPLKIKSESGVPAKRAAPTAKGSEEQRAKKQKLWAHKAQEGPALGSSIMSIMFNNYFNFCKCFHLL